MKSHLTFSLLFVLMLMMATRHATAQHDSHRLLFVGNSLTYTNNLPKLVRQEAADRGIVVHTRELAKPNYAIVDHWAEGDVQDEIRTGQYDVVIIQQGPSSQSDGLHMLIHGGRDYADLAAAHGARLAYFMVWPARQYYFTYDGVIANYTAGAEANNAILLPVGRVWKDHFDATQDYSYYGPDGFHPSKKGSQVAAEVIVDTLFTDPQPAPTHQQAWLSGLGTIDGQMIRVDEVYITAQGEFGTGHDPDAVMRIPWGSLNIEFTACHRATLTYVSDLEHEGVAFGAGSYPIERVVMNHAGRMCDESSFNSAVEPTYFSGSFYGGPERDGQGLHIDYLDESRATVTWYTYLPGTQATGVR